MHISFKKIRTLSYIAISSIFPSLALADFDAGMQAYNQKDYARAYQEWTISADEGDYRANHWLGVLYQSGTGVGVDYTRALEHYEFAAQNDYAPANHALGFLYARGIGVDRDPHQACAYWLLAAVKGISGAQYGVAMCYELGFGFDKDPEQALYWYRAAARNKFGDAASKVADLESQGYGAQEIIAQAPPSEWQKTTPSSQEAAIKPITQAPETKTSVTVIPEKTQTAKIKATTTITSTETVEKGAEDEVLISVPKSTPPKPATSENNITIKEVPKAPKKPVVIVHQQDGQNKIVTEASTASLSELQAQMASKLSSPEASSNPLKTTPQEPPKNIPLPPIKMAALSKAAAVPSTKDDASVRVWLASVFDEQKVTPEWHRLQRIYAPYITVETPIIKQADIAQGTVWRIYAGPTTPTSAQELCVHVKGLNAKYTCIIQPVDQ